MSRSRILPLCRRHLSVCLDMRRFNSYWIRQWNNTEKKHRPDRTRRGRFDGPGHQPRQQILRQTPKKCLKNRRTGNLQHLSQTGVGMRLLLSFDPLCVCNIGTDGRPQHVPQTAVRHVAACQHQYDSGRCGLRHRIKSSIRPRRMRCAQRNTATAWQTYRQTSSRRTSSKDEKVF